MDTDDTPRAALDAAGGAAPSPPADPPDVAAVPSPVGEVTTSDRRTADDGPSPDASPSTPPWAWRFLVHGITTLLRTLFRWRIRLRIEGDVHPADRPAVLVANHTGNVEPFLVAHAVYRATGRWIQPLVKAELFRAPVVKWFAPRAGAIPVERETVGGRGSAYSAAVARLRAGGTIYVAPEATITHDGTLLPLRRGAARLAIEGGVPVIVVTTFGGQRAFSPIKTWPDRGVLFDVVVEQIELDPTEDAAALTGRIAATMLDRATELRDGYPQADPSAPWWPPYAEPAEPSRTGRENLERYREAMTESVAHARERMAAIAEEREVQARVSAARVRARSAADSARDRAADLGEQVRHRADELAELARTGSLGDELRSRVEELAAQARLVAEHAAELRTELRDRREAVDDDGGAEQAVDDDGAAGADGSPAVEPPADPPPTA